MDALKKIKSRYSYSVILLRQLVITDFKLRYQGSALGYVWSLLRPLFLFVILYVVFVKFMRFGSDVPHFPVYLLMGIVVWNFFAEITTTSINAVVGHGDIIRKLNFPKYVLIVSTAFSALINLLLNSIVIAVFMVLSGVEVGTTIVLTPIFIMEVFVFSLALGFILSALFVRLRDINYIWEVIMQALFYLTPIIYPLSLVTERWPEMAKFLLFNPVAQAIQDIRQVTVTPETVTLSELTGRWYIGLLPVAMVVIIAVFAALLFKKRSPYFAEEV
ncbi:MAG TPA: ABC transporter permease [Candidatus Saccharimonadales bacterium]|nr:ABC transporter permease [Candidatus Saccharimonadales bacterium]